MKLSRTKIAKLLKSRTQSRKNIFKKGKSKSFHVTIEKAFTDDDMVLPRRKAFSAHKRKPVNLRLKSLKRWRQRGGMDWDESAFNGLDSPAILAKLTEMANADESLKDDTDFKFWMDTFSAGNVEENKKKRFFAMIKQKELEKKQAISPTFQANQQEAADKAAANEQASSEKQAAAAQASSEKQAAKEQKGIEKENVNANKQYQKSFDIENARKMTGETPEVEAPAGSAEKININIVTKFSNPNADTRRNAPPEYIETKLEIDKPASLEALKTSLAETDQGRLSIDEYLDDTSVFFNPASDKLMLNESTPLNDASAKALKNDSKIIIKAEGIKLTLVSKTGEEIETADYMLSIKVSEVATKWAQHMTATDVPEEQKGGEDTVKAPVDNSLDNIRKYLLFYDKGKNDTVWVDYEGADSQKTLKQVGITSNTTFRIRSKLYAFFERVLYKDLFYMIDVQYIRNMFDYLSTSEESAEYIDLLQVKPFPVKNAEASAAATEQKWEDLSEGGGDRKTNKSSKNSERAIQMRNARKALLLTTGNNEDADAFQRVKADADLLPNIAGLKYNNIIQINSNEQSGKHITSGGANFAWRKESEREEDVKYVGFPIPEYTPPIEPTTDTKKYCLALLAQDTGGKKDDDLFNDFFFAKGSKKGEKEAGINELIAKVDTSILSKIQTFLMGFTIGSDITALEYEKPFFPDVGIQNIMDNYLNNKKKGFFDIWKDPLKLKPFEEALDYIETNERSEKFDIKLAVLAKETQAFNIIAPMVVDDGSSGWKFYKSSNHTKEIRVFRLYTVLKEILLYYEDNPNVKFKMFTRSGDKIGIDTRTGFKKWFTKDKTEGVDLDPLKSMKVKDDNGAETEIDISNPVIVINKFVDSYKYFRLSACADKDKLLINYDQYVRRIVNLMNFGNKADKADVKAGEALDLKTDRMEKYIKGSSVIQDPTNLNDQPLKEQALDVVQFLYFAYYINVHIPDILKPDTSNIKKQQFGGENDDADSKNVVPSDDELIAEPSNAEPSIAEPSNAEPSNAEPSNAEDKNEEGFSPFDMIGVLDTNLEKGVNNDTDDPSLVRVDEDGEGLEPGQGGGADEPKSDAEIESDIEADANNESFNTKYSKTSTAVKGTVSTAALAAPIIGSIVTKAPLGLTVSGVFTSTVPALSANLGITSTAVSGYAWVQGAALTVFTTLGAAGTMGIGVAAIAAGIIAWKVYKWLTRHTRDFNAAVEKFVELLRSTNTPPEPLNEAYKALVRNHPTKLDKFIKKLMDPDNIYRMNALRTKPSKEKNLEFWQIWDIMTKGGNIKLDIGDKGAKIEKGSEQANALKNAVAMAKATGLAQNQKLMVLKSYYKSKVKKYPGLSDAIDKLKKAGDYDNIPKKLAEQLRITSDAAAEHDFKEFIVYFRLRYGMTEDDKSIFEDVDKHILALTEARGLIRNLINKSPSDISVTKDPISVMKMKYYLNFVSYLFLNAQNTSEMVAMLENKNILKKMNAYFQYIDAGDFSNSFKTWRPDGYITKFFSQIRINFKVKGIDPSVVSQLPSRKVDMDKMVDVYAKNKMALYNKSGNKKNELLYQLGDLVKHGDFVKQQMKIMEKYFSMIRCKEFTENGLMIDMPDVPALNDPKIYENLSVLYRDITQTYKNQSINNLYERLKSTKGKSPGERLLKNFFNYEDTDKSTGAKSKQIDVLKNFIATASQAILVMADAYKSAIQIDNNELKRAKEVASAKETAEGDKIKLEAAQGIAEAATEILEEATINKNESQGGGAENALAIGASAIIKYGGGENEINVIKEKIKSIELFLKDIPNEPKEIRRARADIVKNITKLNQLVAGANKQAIYDEAARLKKNADLLLNYIDAAAKSDKESAQQLAAPGAPNAFDPSLLARIKNLENELKNIQGRTDESKMTEDEAAIRAVMMGEDAVAHKIKFLVDIPKWQQFKVIGSTDGSFEDSMISMKMDISRAALKKIEGEYNDILSKYGAASLVQAYDKVSAMDDGDNFKREDDSGAKTGGQKRKGKNSKKKGRHSRGKQSGGKQSGGGAKKLKELTEAVSSLEKHIAEAVADIGAPKGDAGPSGEAEPGAESGTGAAAESAGPSAAAPSAAPSAAAPSAAATSAESAAAESAAAESAAAASTEATSEAGPSASEAGPSASAATSATGLSESSVIEKLMLLLQNAEMKSAKVRQEVAADTEELIDTNNVDAIEEETNDAEDAVNSAQQQVDDLQGRLELEKMTNLLDQITDKTVEGINTILDQVNILIKESVQQSQDQIDALNENLENVNNQLTNLAENGKNNESELVALKADKSAKTDAEKNEKERLKLEKMQINEDIEEAQRSFELKKLELEKDLVLKKEDHRAEKAKQKKADEQVMAIKKMDDKLAKEKAAREMLEQRRQERIKQKEAGAEAAAKQIKEMEPEMKKLVAEYNAAKELRDKLQIRLQAKGLFESAQRIRNDADISSRSKEQNIVSQTLFATERHDNGAYAIVYGIYQSIKGDYNGIQLQHVADKFYLGSRKTEAMNQVEQAWIRAEQAKVDAITAPDIIKITANKTAIENELKTINNIFVPLSRETIKSARLKEIEEARDKAVKATDEISKAVKHMDNGPKGIFGRKKEKGENYYVYLRKQLEDIDNQSSMVILQAKLLNDIATNMQQTTSLKSEGIKSATGNVTTAINDLEKGKECIKTSIKTMNTKADDKIKATVLEKVSDKLESKRINGNSSTGSPTSPSYTPISQRVDAPMSNMSNIYDLGNISIGSSSIDSRSDPYIGVDGDSDGGGQAGDDWTEFIKVIKEDYIEAVQCAKQVERKAKDVNEKAKFLKKFTDDPTFWGIKTNNPNASLTADQANVLEAQVRGITGMRTDETENIGSFSQNQNPEANAYGDGFKQNGGGFKQYGGSTNWRLLGKGIGFGIMEMARQVAKKIPVVRRLARDEKYVRDCTKVEALKFVLEKRDIVIGYKKFVEASLADYQEQKNFAKKQRDLKFDQEKDEIELKKQAETARIAREQVRFVEEMALAQDTRKAAVTTAANAQALALKKEDTAIVRESAAKAKAEADIERERERGLRYDRSRGGSKKSSKKNKATRKRWHQRGGDLSTIQADIKNFNAKISGAPISATAGEAGRGAAEPTGEEKPAGPGAAEPAGEEKPGEEKPETAGEAAPGAEKPAAPGEAAPGAAKPAAPVAAKPGEEKPEAAAKPEAPGAAKPGATAKTGEEKPEAPGAAAPKAEPAAAAPKAEPGAEPGAAEPVAAAKTEEAPEAAKPEATPGAAKPEAAKPEAAPEAAPEAQGGGAKHKRSGSKRSGSKHKRSGSKRSGSKHKRSSTKRSSTKRSSTKHKRSSTKRSSTKRKRSSTKRKRRNTKPSISGGTPEEDAKEEEESKKIMEKKKACRAQVEEIIKTANSGLPADVQILNVKTILDNKLAGAENDESNKKLDAKNKADAKENAKKVADATALQKKNTDDAKAASASGAEGASASGAEGADAAKKGEEGDKKEGDKEGDKKEGEKEGDKKGDKEGEKKGDKEGEKKEDKKADKKAEKKKGGYQSGGTPTENIKKLKDLQALLSKLKIDCQGDIPYGVKLGEGINVIEQIINGKMHEQSAAEKSISSSEEPKKKEKQEPSAEAIGDTIVILKSLKDALKNKRKKCQGENAYGIQLAVAINDIEEIIIGKIHQQEGAVKKKEQEKVKKVEAKPEPGNCAGRFSEGMEEGGRKTKKHRHSKHKHSKHKRTKHKRIRTKP